MDRSDGLKTPVAIMIFNRPDTTEKVFHAIRQARPSKLLVVADGPRAERPGEAEKCAAARAVVDRVDWPCEVLKNYSETNLGCGVRPATGTDWIFDQVEEAIILEDDCVPHPTFFPYCEELLERYRHDERVMHIAGTNWLVDSRKGDYSYYFSMFPNCSARAGWRRAWRHYDFNMKLFSEVQRDRWLDCVFPDKRVAKYWEKRFEEVRGPHKKHIWDYQWTFACWMQNGLSIIPNVSLVTNIGFRPDGTHTKDSDSPFAEIPLAEMRFPMRHPAFVVRDTEADGRFQKRMFTERFGKRLRRRLNRILSRSTP